MDKFVSLKVLRENICKRIANAGESLEKCVVYANNENVFAIFLYIFAKTNFRHISAEFRFSTIMEKGFFV